MKSVDCSSNVWSHLLLLCKILWQIPFISIATHTIGRFTQGRKSSLKQILLMFELVTQIRHANQQKLDWFERDFIHQIVWQWKTDHFSRLQLDLLLLHQICFMCSFATNHARFCWAYACNSQSEAFRLVTTENAISDSASVPPLQCWCW